MLIFSTTQRYGSNEVAAMMTFCEFETWAARADGKVRLGFDLARISDVAASIRQFGRRYTDRVFTAGELDYAVAGQCAERLAARFAAKEAVIKALGLSETGIGWRDIEVVRQLDGACAIRLHGPAARVARELGAGEMALSLSHDGDYAGAVVQVSLDNGQDGAQP